MLGIDRHDVGRLREPFGGLDVVDFTGNPEVRERDWQDRPPRALERKPDTPFVSLREPSCVRVDRHR